MAFSEASALEMPKTDADSFYDTLLASIGHGRYTGCSARTEDVPQRVDVADEARIKQTPAPPRASPPFAKAKTEQSDAILRPLERTPPATTPVARIELAGAPMTAPRIDKAATASTSSAAKSSTQLEAELRAKLLASTRKRKAQVATRPSPLPPLKKPRRGSPVRIAVPLTGSSPMEEPSPKQSGTPRSPVSPSLPSQEASSVSQPHGKSALPPKPPRRDGFKLRIKLPFSFAGSSSVTLETEKLPLTTPISAILDLFNRRSSLDHLHFAPPLPRDDTYMSDRTRKGGDGGDGVGLGIAIHSGQNFYRDPPRNAGIGGWRDPAPSRGGPNWDPGVGNLRATLEDVATVYGAEVVECEIRCGPSRKSSLRRGSGGGAAVDSKQADYHEEENDDQWQEAEPEDEWGQPATVQGQCDYNAYVSPGRWNAAVYPGMQTPMNWTAGVAPYPQHVPSLGPDFEPAQRWIPGHQDYSNAGWRFGFSSNDGQHESAFPSRPLPPQAGPLTPVTSTATASLTPPIPMAPRASAIPSHVPSRPHATENKKSKKRAPNAIRVGGGGGGGGGKKKNKGSSLKKGGQSRGGGGGNGGGTAAANCA